MRAVVELQNRVRHYAWGSRTAIANLLGAPSPSDKPEAELWIGAHPEAPSSLIHDGTHEPLDRVIANDPVGTLGPRVLERFGPRLPFLLKILAAAEPLSLQAHPDAAQAWEGYEREELSGMSRSAPERNYRDASPKPELIVALTPFSALRGFRDMRETVELFQALNLKSIAAELSALIQAPDPTGLRVFYEALTRLPDAQRPQVAEEASARASRLESRHPAFAWVARLGQYYPSDTGVLAPLLLNLVQLEPGEGLFLGPGELHSYLEGVGVEIMASSDNVLRGGLTPKHVDTEELLRVLTFEPGVPEVLKPTAPGGGVPTYSTPAREFELGVIDVRRDRRHGSGPRDRVEILLATEGQVALSTPSQSEVSLGKGRALFVPASVGRYTLEGQGRVWRATVPLSE